MRRISFAGLCLKGWLLKNSYDSSRFKLPQRLAVGNRLFSVWATHWYGLGFCQAKTRRRRGRRARAAPAQSPGPSRLAHGYAQMTHSIGLNDVCDSLQLHSGPLAAIRGASAPSRNGLSNANRERPAEMAEQLFWQVMNHLGEQSPGFVAGRSRGAAFRFKMPIHVVDTTVLELVANCMDWAQHRRRKAAAKTHMRLNLQSLLPNFVIIDTAGEHDNKRARELCAGVKSGEIVLFDKGYVDFGHLRDLDERGVSWVTRAKDNMAYDAVRTMPRSKDEKILRDEVIVLSNPNKSAPELMRRIVAVVEIDGKELKMGT